MPNRIIKESVCTSETIDKMSWFEECFFHRLWTHCDDYGCMDARPAILKAKLFPLKERMTLKNVEDALEKLVDIGCVITYMSDGKPYLYLPAWEVHQTVRAKKRKYPEPEIICMQMQADASECSRKPIQFESNPNPESVSESKGEAHTRHKYGQYGWVLLTDAQYQKLVSDLGQAEVDRCIKYVDESAQSTGNKNGWKDWNLTVRKCSRDKWGTKQGQSGRFDALIQSRRNDDRQGSERCPYPDGLVLDELQSPGDG